MVDGKENYKFGLGVKGLTQIGSVSVHYLGHQRLQPHLGQSPDILIVD